MVRRATGWTAAETDLVAVGIEVDPVDAQVDAQVVPVRLRVPGIGVDSKLMDLGLNRDGTLQTPPGGFPAGWFSGAPTPGEVGPAIIVGHVRYGAPGVFARLTDMRGGDAILVDRRDGSTARFRVTRVARFAKSEFPTKQVYGNIDHAGLRLITCGGARRDHERVRRERRGVRRARALLTSRSAYNHLLAAPAPDPRSRLPRVRRLPDHVPDRPGHADGIG